MVGCLDRNRQRTTIRQGIGRPSDKPGTAPGFPGPLRAHHAEVHVPLDAVVFITPTDAVRRVGCALFGSSFGQPTAVLSDDGTLSIKCDERAAKVNEILANAIADGTIPARMKADDQWREDNGILVPIIRSDVWHEVTKPSQSSIAKLLASGAKADTSLRLSRTHVERFCASLPPYISDAPSASPDIATKNRPSGKQTNRQKEAEDKAAAYLQQRADLNEPFHNKNAAISFLLHHIPGLSQEAAQRAWKVAAKPEWRRKGRKPTTKGAIGGLR